MKLPQHGRYDYVPLPQRKDYDWLEEMVEQSEKHPLVCSISIHPHTFGYPFRLRPLRRALEHCFSNKFVDRVWKCRPGEIADYCLTLPPGTIP